MLQIYFKTARDEEFQVLQDLREGCWIHVDEGTPEDIAAIAQLLNLDYTDLQDALDKYEVPRIERVQNNVLIFTRHPTEQELGLYTSTLTIILSPNYTITISPQRSHLVRHFLHQKSKLSTIQKSKLLIALLMRITQEFTAHIRRVRNNVLRQEKEMITVESEDITALTKNEEVLNQYHSALIPLRNVLEAITSGRYTSLYEKDQDLLLDLLNAVKQSEDLCSISVKSIRSLRDSYQIIFTNNVSKTIKLLTALTILFSIPTMIASLYGMNVQIPFTTYKDAFFYIVGFISVILILAIMLFQRKRWL
ncbi:MAG: magnesium transporter CorA family protein [Verrucomicrobia bacterium]|nr:magnesium transporter CorA family protein [Verrucomicrobiota bacterium]